jgi:hypothetical protein
MACKTIQADLAMARSEDAPDIDLAALPLIEDAI